MNNIMIAVGKYRFSIETAAYQQLTRVSQYRWQAQNRIGRTPAQQYLGPGSDTITLPGTIYPHYKGGLKQIDAMRAEAGLGEPLRVVTGLGHVLGSWCITEVEEVQTNFASLGVPLKQTFRLTMIAYGDDDGQLSNPIR
ncbi:Uncharacterised protein [BD1-7 clade bacterium]|uniref:Phage tail protein n=1 Tax=BD1-7 clade bacterium TaxID=2029982 RepID=A0A5S9Q2X5_9GAMM|nr:Uncharacterised protein [BD1-7 clade bacterium]CAA0111862.1 Uncharacterised protein [BD1-7 clade bacterium]